MLPVLVGFCLAVAGAAQASVVTVGSAVPGNYKSTEFGTVETLFNLNGTPITLPSPVSGAILRWRIQGAGGGPFYLRVLRPRGQGAYQAVGTSGPGIPFGLAPQTFQTVLNIEAGDLIGLDPTSGEDKIGVATGGEYASIYPPPADWGSLVVPPKHMGQIALAAEIQPQPFIDRVSPSFGSVAGGTVVTILGENFSGASHVAFGLLPATSFTVNSDTEITAVTPKVSSQHEAQVVVTTVAGRNPIAFPHNNGGDGFLFIGCVVPRIKNRTLTEAKEMLRRSFCRLGHVRKVRAPRPGKVGKILKQSPRPGKVLEPGTRVRIVLGKAPSSQGGLPKSKRFRRSGGRGQAVAYRISGSGGRFTPSR